MWYRWRMRCVWKTPWAWLKCGRDFALLPPWHCPRWRPWHCPRWRWGFFTRGSVLCNRVLCFSGTWKLTGRGWGSRILVGVCGFPWRWVERKSTCWLWAKRLLEWCRDCMGDCITVDVCSERFCSFPMNCGIKWTAGGRSFRFFSLS